MALWLIPHSNIVQYTYTKWNIFSNFFIPKIIKKNSPQYRFTHACPLTNATVSFKFVFHLPTVLCIDYFQKWFAYMVWFAICCCLISYRSHDYRLRLFCIVSLMRTFAFVIIALSWYKPSTLCRCNLVANLTRQRHIYGN